MEEEPFENFAYSFLDVTLQYYLNISRQYHYSFISPTFHHGKIPFAVCCDFEIINVMNQYFANEN